MGTPSQFQAPEMKKKPRRKNGLQQAIEKAGGVGKLAAGLKISSQAISQWKRARKVPVERVLDVERFTGVHRHYLNRDIYPDPPATPTA